jgi:hypothetical protein
MKFFVCVRLCTQTTFVTWREQFFTSHCITYWMLIGFPRPGILPRYLHTHVKCKNEAVPAPDSQRSSHSIVFLSQHLWYGVKTDMPRDLVCKMGFRMHSHAASKACSHNTETLQKWMRMHKCSFVKSGFESAQPDWKASGSLKKCLQL